MAQDSARTQPPRDPFWKSPVFWSGLVGMLVALKLGSMLLHPPKPLPVLAQLPAFQLTDQDGNAFNPGRMQGHVTIANFIFTTCPTVCPRLSSQMAQLQKRTEKLGQKVQLASFSVDPATDTPAVLKAYGRKYGQDAARWTFVTGDEKAIEQTVSDGFKVALTREPRADAGADAAAFDIVHGEHFVLVDGEGRIRGYYRKDDQELERMVQDAARLAHVEAP